MSRPYHWPSMLARCAVLALGGLLAAAGVGAEPTELPPQARQYLFDYLGRWESHATIFEPDGKIARETRGEFGEVVLLDGRINLHTSYNADGTENKAFRYYNPEQGKFYLVDVTWNGVLWVLSGDAEHGGDIMTSLEHERPDGGKVMIRFTHTNRQEDSFESTMDVSFDAGNNWNKRSHTIYRRTHTTPWRAGESEQGRAQFDKIAAYLSNGSGRWRAPNNKHNPDNPSSPVALGLWFERRVRGHALELTVVGHLGSETRTYSRSYWFWHPSKRQIIYEEISLNGAVRSGTAVFVDDVTFVTFTEALDATGKPIQNKGENVILNENSHRTVAYKKGPDGSWVEFQALTWELEASD